MLNYFYHCTINTIDILIRGKLQAQLTMGSRYVSFFKTSGENPFKEKSKYYRTPDNKNEINLGESLYPIKAAFCFEPGLKNYVPGHLSKHPDYDTISGLIKKGKGEYLFPGDIELNNESFWGIRIPKDEEDSEESYIRLIAAMYLTGKKEIRIAYQCNDFYQAHTLFHLIRDKLRSENLEPNPDFFKNKEDIDKLNKSLDPA